MANFSNDIMIGGGFFPLGHDIKVVGFWDNPEFGFHGVGGAGAAAPPAPTGMVVPGLNTPIAPQPLEAAPSGRPPTRARDMRDPPELANLESNLALIAREVRHVILHHDVTFNSASCFNVLNQRGLSSHFLINFDGNVIQGLDPWWMGIHARDVNRTSIGVDLNNVASVEGHQVSRQDPLFGGIAHYETRPVVRGPAGGSREKESFEYTEAQYVTLAEILKRLHETIGLPLIYPQSPNGGVVTRRLHSPTTFRGFMGHWHCQAGKWDPGPGFYWDELMERLHGESKRWPVDLGTAQLGELQTAEAVTEATQVFFDNTEQGGGDGTYPIGLNQDWHDGIQLYPELGAAVTAVADGKIILTRNGPNLPLGSPNFVLIQHDFERERLELNEAFDSEVIVENVRYYSLYMHLERMDHEQVPEQAEDDEDARSATAVDARGRTIPEWFIRLVQHARESGGGRLERTPDLRGHFETSSEVEEFVTTAIGRKTIQDLAHAHECIEAGHPYRWVSDPDLDEGIPVASGDVIGYVGEYGELVDGSPRRRPTLGFQIFSRRPVFDDTLFDERTWRRVQSDLTHTSLVKDRELVTAILGEETVLDRGITRPDFSQGRLLTPSEIEVFYRSGRPDQRRFRRVIARHLSQWDAANDDAMTAGVPILWPWATDREYAIWRAHHIGFRWLTEEVRPLLGMVEDDVPVPQPIYTYHPIYLLGWWALNYGRSLNIMTFEAQEEAAFREAVESFELGDEDLESAEDHAGHIIDVSELDTFNLEYPAFDMLENGEWGGDFDLEER